MLRVLTGQHHQTQQQVYQQHQLQEPDQGQGHMHSYVLQISYTYLKDPPPYTCTQMTIPTHKPNRQRRELDNNRSWTSKRRATYLVLPHSSCNSNMQYRRRLDYRYNYCTAKHRKEAGNTTTGPQQKDNNISGNNQAIQHKGLASHISRSYPTSLQYHFMLGCQGDMRQYAQFNSIPGIIKTYVGELAVPYLSISARNNLILGVFTAAVYFCPMQPPVHQLLLSPLFRLYLLVIFIPVTISSCQSLHSVWLIHRIFLSNSRPPHNRLFTNYCHDSHHLSVILPPSVCLRLICQVTDINYLTSTHYPHLHTSPTPHQPVRYIPVTLLLLMNK